MSPGARSSATILILDIIATSSVVTTLAVHVFQPWYRSPLGRVLSFVVPVAIVLPVVHAFLQEAGRRLAVRPLARRLLLAGCSLCGGLLAVLAIPLHPGIPRHARLEIVATGQRDENAKGSEVWLNAIEEGPRRATAADLQLGPGWELRDGVPVSYRAQPATLRWKGFARQPLTLTFHSHPWSGRVLVHWGPKYQRVDLYSELPTTRVVTLPPLATELRTSAPLYLADVVTLSLLLFGIGALLVRREVRPAAPVVVSRAAWLVYASPLMALWGVYLLAYWPGGMSPDSVDQWSQMLKFKFNDWHPAFHTLTNWAITRLWPSPAAIAVVQIVVLSLVIGWSLSEIRRAGAPRWFPWLAIATLAIMPSVATIVVVLWKDIFYSAWLLAFSILVLKVVTTHGEWLCRPTSWISLGITGALLALYRHNGSLVGTGTLLVLLLAYRHRWRQLALALVVAIGVSQGVRGPLYSSVGVDRAAQPPGIGIATVHLLGRFTIADTDLSPDERAALRALRPDARWPYDCYMDNAVLFDGKLNWPYLTAHSPDLAALAGRLALRDPATFFEHLECNSAFLYRITQPPGSTYEGVTTDIAPNTFGLAPESKIPDVKITLDEWMAWASEYFGWAFWRGAFWNYLLLAGVLVHWVRSRDWRVVLLTVPVLLNTLPLALFAAGQGFRYALPLILVGTLIGGYLLTTPPRPAPEPR